MTVVLLILIVGIIPIIFLSHYLGSRTVLHVLFRRGGIICLILLILWAVMARSHGGPGVTTEISPALYLLATGLGCLGLLCIEDLASRTVPVVFLVATVCILISYHFFRLWPDKGMLFTDYIYAACCAGGIWVLASFISKYLGHAALGEADPPLIFALSLGMNPHGISVWITLFSAAALGSHILAQAMLNSRNDVLDREIPLIPYMAGTAAIIHVIG